MEMDGTYDNNKIKKPLIFTYGTEPKQMHQTHLNWLQSGH